MYKIFYFIFFVVIMLFGCSQDDGIIDESDQKDGEDKASNFDEGIYPFTGLPADDSVDNRMISVMVNNHTDARPQSGLSKADIVIEILVEGEITRFLALYQSEIPDVVGPIRSAREYYFNLANHYNALYVYHGATDSINDMIVNDGTHFLNGSVYDNDGKLFKRESFRKAPHNSYLQLEAVYEVAENKGYPVKETYEPLLFLDDEEIISLNGEVGQRVQISYGNRTVENVEFKYDEASGNYKRYSNGSQTIELDSGVAITAENIFIIETSHGINDETGHRVIDVESGGSALLFQKGKMQRVEWQNIDGRILPVKDGHPIGFVRGKTWINVIPSIEETVTVSDE